MYGCWTDKVKTIYPPNFGEGVGGCGDGAGCGQGWGWGGVSVITNI